METNVEKRSRLRSELDTLKTKYNETRDEGTLERLNNLKTALTKVERAIIAEAAENPNNVEAGHHVDTRRKVDRGPGAEARNGALRAIESRSKEISATSADRLDDLVRRDRSGSDSRYIAAVADSDYESAFGKLIGSPNAGVEMDDRERAAFRAVAEARTLQVGTPELGGYAIPFALDPTINLESDGEINPLRLVARVTQITTDEWRGVASEGITAKFAGELTEVGDDSPELRQPTIRPEKAQAFVPFSIEAGQDWPALQEEVTYLFRDAKDILEAEKFISGKGSGSDEPQGLHTGGTAVVATAGTATFAVGDVYTLQEAIPPRFASRASWLAANQTVNTMYRMVAVGDEDEPALVTPDRSRMLGRSLWEVSTMTTAGTAPGSGGTILTYGDYNAGYRIVDRVGASVEVVPHLFGTANNRPIGARGLYMYWRVGAGVVIPKAIKSLKVK